MDEKPLSVDRNLEVGQGIRFVREGSIEGTVGIFVDEIFGKGQRRGARITVVYEDGRNVSDTIRDEPLSLGEGISVRVRSKKDLGQKIRLYCEFPRGYDAELI